MTAGDRGCCRSGLSGNLALSHPHLACLPAIRRVCGRKSLKFIENKWWHYFDLMFALIALLRIRRDAGTRNKWCWGSTQNSCKWPTHMRSSPSSWNWEQGVWRFISLVDWFSLSFNFTVTGFQFSPRNVTKPINIWKNKKQTHLHGPDSKDSKLIWKWAKRSWDQRKWRTKANKTPHLYGFFVPTHTWSYFQQQLFFGLTQIWPATHLALPATSTKRSH